MALVFVGALALDLFEHDDNDGARFEPKHTGLDHLSFIAQSAAELEAWTSWLDFNDVEHSPIRDAAGFGLMFDFADPDGIQLEFIWVDDDELDSQDPHVAAIYRATRPRHPTD